MNYLAADYRLQPVDQAAYQSQATSVALLKRGNPLEQTLKAVLAAEAPEMIDHIHAYAATLDEAYGIGGGFYSLSSAVGISVLRAANPDAPAIGPDDWAQVIAREAELHGRSGVRTVEEVAGIGLLEIRGVNPGYVDGYQETYSNPALIPHLGFTGLGHLHAHDLMHFASLR